MDNAQALDHTLFSSIIQATDSNFRDLGAVDLIRDSLNHGVNKTESCLSDRNTRINFVLERTKIDLLDQGMINRSL
jgi:hypothetical protein